MGLTKTDISRGPENVLCWRQEESSNGVNRMSKHVETCQNLFNLLMAWSCSGTTLAGRFAWTKVWGRGHCLLNPCHSGPESCFVLVRFIRSLYVLGSVLLVVQLSLVCGIFQQPAMSASPGPKPFWPDGRTWAVRTHRNVPMPLQRQWTVKAVVCSCICAWFILIHQCSQHLLFQPWLIMLIPLGSESCAAQEEPVIPVKLDSCPTMLAPAKEVARIQTVTDAELKHLENKQSCRAFHCSELWIGYDWIIEDYWRLLCSECSIMFYGKSPFLMGKLTINGHFQ